MAADQRNDLSTRRRAALDLGRPDAVARSRQLGHLTARERVEALLDSGSFVEHGLHAAPASGVEGPADGIIVGVGSVGGRPTAVVSYDYSVMGGTQGVVSHAKLDHILELALARRWALVVVAEGGGARAQEMSIGNYGRRVMSFAGLAKLSGVVPLVGIVPGRSFGGHAALAGLTDLIIATTDAVLGIAGPPFVEAATGHRVTPEELGAVDIHERAGTVDVVVDDDTAAIGLARRYLDLVSHPDQDAAAPAEGVRLDDVVPRSSREVYDVHLAIEGLVDVGTEIELRPRFAPNLVTALARIDGRAVGIVANQPAWLAGAIDRDAADKMARFVQLCDAHRLAVLFLADTPGFLVGPEAERSGLIRHSSRPILALAHATVPVMLVVMRKAFGLGYFAMGTRPFDPVAMVAWPTAEFGSMGHRGAAAVSDLDEGEIAADHSPLAFAAKFAIDDIVEPSDTRRLLEATLRAVPASTYAAPSPTKPIDAW